MLTPPPLSRGRCNSERRRLPGTPSSHRRLKVDNSKSGAIHAVVELHIRGLQHPSPNSPARSGSPASKPATASTKPEPAATSPKEPKAAPAPSPAPASTDSAGIRPRLLPTPQTQARPTRVQIPPPPLTEPKSRMVERDSGPRAGPQAGWRPNNGLVERTAQETRQSRDYRAGPGLTCFSAAHQSQGCRQGSRPR